MKGAIGNALILNIVITFMIIFFSLLIGSMAYSKAYKTKNYLLNMVDKYETAGKTYFYVSEESDGQEWDGEVNEYLAKIGYILSKQKNTCPIKYTKGKTDPHEYNVLRQNEGYDYCIYRRYDIHPSDNNDSIIDMRYNYMVLVYMKFDFPIIGNFIKIPITGETKSYTILR